MTSYVYLVDDDDGVRSALTALLSTMGWQVIGFSDGQSFLNALQIAQPSCVLLDIRMPGKSGMVVLDAIKARDFTLPVIIMTGHGNVELCRRAFKGGAIEFLTKPIDADLLIESVNTALEQHQQALTLQKRQSVYQQRIDQLSAREKEVLILIVQGKTSKQIATELYLSPRTVEAHRANIFSKLESNSLACVINDYGSLLSELASLGSSTE